MKNIVYQSGEGGVTLRMTVGSGVVAGDLVEFVDLHGVAVTSYAAVDGKADVLLPGVMTVAALSVTAKNNSTGSAVAIGDKLYYDAGETPDEINKDSTAGKACGYALSAVDSGATATINVALAN
jgi:hypothetical protein